MDINSLLSAKLWLHIAEISPGAHIAFRSVNGVVRSYTNHHVDKYKTLFCAKKSIITDECVDSFTELPNGMKHVLYVRKAQK